MLWMVFSGSFDDIQLSIFLLSCGCSPRYYTGHKGKFGHEYMEFEFLPSGVLKYANNSSYKSKESEMIRKQVR